MVKNTQGSEREMASQIGSQVEIRIQSGQRWYYKDRQ